MFRYVRQSQDGSPRASDGMKADDETKFNERLANSTRTSESEWTRVSGRNVQPSCRIAKHTRDARFYRDDALRTHLIPYTSARVYIKRRSREEEENYSSVSLF